MPGMSSVEIPALDFSLNLANDRDQGPRCVLLVAAVRSVSDQAAAMLTSLVRMSAIGIPDVFCGLLSPTITPRAQLGMYQLSRSIISSLHHGLRESETTRYCMRSESEFVCTELVLA